MYKSEATEFSWLSLAYLDAGIFLAEAIVRDDFSDSVHRTLVPLFLIHQALELLYKSALRSKGIEYPKTHDLRRLKTEFRKYFPELDFDVPDVVLAPENTNYELFPEDPSPTIVQHERLRYPTDKKGRPWSTDSSIDLKESINEIVALKKPALDTWWKVLELPNHT
jgi:hypothetical protein